MRLDIHSQSRLRADLRGSISRRLRFVLGRFGSRVQSATVRLWEESEGHGDSAKRCEIVVRLAPRRTVSVEDAAESFPSVVRRVTDRIGRSVQRELERPLAGISTDPVRTPARGS
jgi:hypothetical protein